MGGNIVLNASATLFQAGGTKSRGLSLPDLGELVYGFNLDTGLCCGVIHSASQCFPV